MMAESLSRRKYAKLVKFFTELVTDEKVSDRVRLTAACRLDDIFARNEQRADRIAERKHKAMLAAVEITPATSVDVEASEKPLSAEARALELLKRIEDRKGTTND
jgi:hypothetical protein